MLRLKQVDQIHGSHFTNPAMGQVVVLLQSLNPVLTYPPLDRHE